MSEHTLPTLCNLALCAYHVPGYNLQPRTPRETNGALPSNRCSMGALQDDAASTGCVSPTGTQSKQDTDSWHLKTHPSPHHPTWTDAPVTQSRPASHDKTPDQPTCKQIYHPPFPFPDMCIQQHITSGNFLPSPPKIRCAKWTIHTGLPHRNN